MKKKNDQIILKDFGLSADKGNEVSEPFEKRSEEQIKKEIKNLQDSLYQTKKEFEDFKKEQNIKLVEFLGIFTAILAFITISGKIVIDNLNTLNILILLPAFAVLLMLFVLTIDAIIIKGSKKWIWRLLFGFVIIEGFLIWLSFKGGWLT